MKRFIVLTVALGAIAAMSVLPASATHTATPITITVTSTYAGLCGANPGPDTSVPSAWSNALTANAGMGADEKVPADLWKANGGTGAALGNVSGQCTYGTDALWNAAVVARGTATCNLTVKTGCRGLHYPFAGPPVQPGRFLNFAKHSAVPDPKNVCQFVSTAAPNVGTCTAIAVGYTFAVGVSGDSELEGSYCGTSRGFTWAQAIPSPSGDTTYSVLEWMPTSAGSILPVTGVIAGTNWAKNTHYKGWEGTPGKPSMRFKAGTTKNVLLLTSARSYVPNVDNESTTPGSCSGTLDNGGVQFFNQGVGIGIGDAS